MYVHFSIKYLLGEAGRVFSELELAGTKRSTPGEASTALPTVRGLPRLCSKSSAWGSHSPRGASLEHPLRCRFNQLG